jgi:integrase
MKLEWVQVDWTKNRFILEGKHMKSGKRHSIMLNEEARMALLDLARYRAENCPDSPWVFVRPNGARLQELDTAFRWLLRQVGITEIFGFTICDILLRHGW